MARATARQFLRDECPDVAAGVTYYGVLSVFPALMVVVSLLGVVGQGQTTTNTVLQIIGQLAPPSAVQILRSPVQQAVTSPSAGFTLAAGVVIGLWTASRYVGAFGRALNRIYGVQEGRPWWKLLPRQVLLTALTLLVSAAVALMLALSGPLAKTIGGLIGAGDAAMTAWAVAPWPVILAFVIVVVDILYYATPNIEQPGFRWITFGAALAIVVWVAASALFAFYVSNFGSYNKTYGTLAGIVVFLLWLWITNLALLLGAEVNAELERGRELQAGMAAQQRVQLPCRDTELINKDRAKNRHMRALAERIRRMSGASHSR
ncbi:membrane protein [Mycobacterium sp. OAS707]|uniref:YihY/virulence factor BrkB family protein n=1 Tax=Mycobacterium sp. OAS707 TaxID=2663822 RepID=UPI001A00D2EF|nr:membrane protein [Mycobacterium sp. OAS707]